MTNPVSRLTCLGDLSIDTFLRDYWQKKPLFVKGAFTNFSSPLSPDELAGFALESGVTSRLVTENKAENTWRVEHGPIDEDRFDHLPEQHWTLLVQHVDSLDPKVNKLVNAFRFVPQWRIEDIMVSFAADGGGVGPHFDYYDVFLLQAEGKKRWRLGQQCSKDSALVPELPMKILREFNTHADWIVEPGDLLYVPARIAHWGESVGESLTYSVGLRAPSHADVLLDYSQELAALADEEQRLGDNALRPQDYSGEINTEAHHQVRQVLHHHYGDAAKLQRWLGEYSTQLKQEIDEYLTPFATKSLSQDRECRLNPFCRCAFSTINDRTLIFINGESWQCSRELAIVLSEYTNFSHRRFSKQDSEVIENLARRGFLEAH